MCGWWKDKPVTEREAKDFSISGSSSNKTQIYSEQNFQLWKMSLLLQLEKMKIFGGGVQELVKFFTNKFLFSEFSKCNDVNRGICYQT